MKEQAMQKIEKERCNGPVAELQKAVMCWLEADDDAAGFIMTEGKTINGLFEFLKETARKNESNGCCCINGDDSEGMSLVLNYFGMDKDKAHSRLEKGLMYDMGQVMLSRWKPYGAHVENTTNPQPVADIPQEPAKDPEAKAFSLDDFSMEDML